MATNAMPMDAPYVTEEVEADFGDDARIPLACRVVHVTIPATLDSCTLTPQYSIDGGTTFLTVAYDNEGRSYPLSGITDVSNPATFILPPGCLFRMTSSVAQTESWFVRATN